MRAAPSVLVLAACMSCTTAALAPAVGAQESREAAAPAFRSVALESPPALGAADRWSRLAMPARDDRELLVYRPASFEPGGPMVLLLHGGGLSAARMFTGANPSGHWVRVADREGVLLVAPDGTQVGGPLQRLGNRRQWCDIRIESASKADDVGFLTAVIDGAIAELGADPDRVYVTGSSNGGMMTMGMLVERSEKVAAAAAFLASLPEIRIRVRAPARPVPLLLCNGTEDPLVQYEGGPIEGGRGVMSPVEECVAWWVSANRCEPEAADVEELEDRDPGDGCTITRRIYRPRPAEQDELPGAPVVFLRVAGGGHAMPSPSAKLPDTRIVRRMIGTLCKDAEGAELAWDFFRRFRRESR